MNTEQALKQYRAQHGSARARRIPWEISFAQWCLWWIMTGHYDQRGRGPGCYSMARLNGSGAIALGNIECVPNESVTRAFWTGTRRRQAVRHNRLQAQQRRRRLHTPRGDFDSLTQAAQRYRLSTSGMVWRIQHHPDDYYYLT